TVKSASFPTSIEPLSFSSKTPYAGQIVNIFNACSRETACSGCQPSADSPVMLLRATAAQNSIIGSPRSTGASEPPQMIEPAFRNDCQAYAAASRLIAK